MSNDKNNNPKKVFKEIYMEDFEDPCEEFVDVLYDLIDEDIIKHELKKINAIKEKNGKVYIVEKVRRGQIHKKNINN